MTSTYQITGTNRVDDLEFPVSVTATLGAPHVLGVEIRTWDNGGVASPDVVLTFDLDSNSYAPSPFRFDVAAVTSTPAGELTVMDGADRYLTLADIDRVFDMKSETRADRYAGTLHMAVTIAIAPADD